jgi:hypothetical protein
VVRAGGAAQAAGGIVGTVNGLKETSIMHQENELSGGAAKPILNLQHRWVAALVILLTATLVLQRGEWKAAAAHQTAAP